MHNLKTTKSFFFDCDGVLLDSNRIKTEAFREVAIQFGPRSTADAFVEFHRSNGGISRFTKLEALFKNFLKQQNYTKSLQEAIELYGRLVLEKLRACPENVGTRQFLENLPKESVRFVVSGGLEDEVRDVLTTKGLHRYFDGIYGSPRTKHAIISELAAQKKFEFPAIFFGDSKLDYETAASLNMNFVFLSDLTEFDAWPLFFKSIDVLCVNNFENLLSIQVEQ